MPVIGPERRNDSFCKHILYYLYYITILFDKRGILVHISTIKINAKL